MAHAEKITPYNTGKVMIGCHYVQYEQKAMTRDGLRLQSALLLSKKPRNANKADRAVMVCVIAISVILPVASYVFNMKLGG